MAKSLSSSFRDSSAPPDAVAQVDLLAGEYVRAEERGIFMEDDYESEHVIVLKYFRHKGAKTLDDDMLPQGDLRTELNQAEHILLRVPENVAYIFDRHIKPGTHVSIEHAYGYFDMDNYGDEIPLIFEADIDDLDVNDPIFKELLEQDKKFVNLHNVWIMPNESMRPLLEHAALDEDVRHQSVGAIDGTVWYVNDQAAKDVSAQKLIERCNNNKGTQVTVFTDMSYEQVYEFLGRKAGAHDHKDTGTSFARPIEFEELIFKPGSMTAQDPRLPEDIPGTKAYLDALDARRKETNHRLGQLTTPEPH